MATYGSGTYGSGLYGSGTSGSPDATFSAVVGGETASGGVAVLGSGGSSAATFTYSFEMATTSTPRTAAPAYTDLSSFVMLADGMRFARGRGSEQEATAQPGRGSVTLKNTDNRFTMGNGSSPYAPLQLRRPCRFRVTYSGTTYDRWQGFVDTWANDRVELTGVARLGMSDRLARAAKVVFPNAIEAEILRDSPIVLFPLQEGAQERDTWRSTYSASGVVYELRVNFPANATVTPGIAVDLGPDPTTQVAFTQLTSTVDGGSLSSTSPPTGFTGQSRSVSAFAFVSSAVTVDATIAGSTGCAIRVGTDGIPWVQGVLISAYSTQPITDGRIHHLAATAVYTGTTCTVQLYVDGVLVATGSGADTAVMPSNTSVTIMQNASGRISHYAAYSTALSAARIAEQAAARTSWTGETTTARFNRLCARAGLPSSWYTTTGTTAVTVGPQPTAGVTLLDAIAEVATTELGAAYLSDAGVLTFATASTRYNKATGLTLNASKAGQVLAGDLDFRTDSDFLVNDVTATRDGGTEQRAQDATSIAAYDTVSRRVTLVADNDTVCLNWAQWSVATGKDPLPRCESVTVDALAFAATGGNVADLLNADVGTKVRIDNLPADIYPSSTLDLFIEGVEDEVTKDTYRIKFTTSPVALEDTVWILDTDLLGVGTVLGY